MTDHIKVIPKILRIDTAGKMITQFSFLQYLAFYTWWVCYVQFICFSFWAESWARHYCLQARPIYFQNEQPTCVSPTIFPQPPPTRRSKTAGVMEHHLLQVTQHHSSDLFALSQGVSPATPCPTLLWDCLYNKVMVQEGSWTGIKDEQ